MTTGSENLLELVLSGPVESWPKLTRTLADQVGVSPVYMRSRATQIKRERRNAARMPVVVTPPPAPTSHPHGTGPDALARYLRNYTVTPDFTEGELSRLFEVSRVCVRDYLRLARLGVLVVDA